MPAFLRGSPRTWTTLLGTVAGKHLLGLVLPLLADLDHLLDVRVVQQLVRILFQRLLKKLKLRPLKTSILDQLLPLPDPAISPAFIPASRPERSAMRGEWTPTLMLV